MASNKIFTFVNNSLCLCALLVGLTNSFFWFGRTASTLFGQIAVEKYGHVVSLCGSMFISCIPIAIFTILMPETMNSRQIKSGTEDGLSLGGQKGDAVGYTKMT